MLAGSTYILELHLAPLARRPLLFVHGARAGFPLYIKTAVETLTAKTLSEGTDIPLVKSNGILNLALSNQSGKYHTGSQNT